MTGLAECGLALSGQSCSDSCSNSNRYCSDLSRNSRHCRIAAANLNLSFDLRTSCPHIRVLMALEQAAAGHPRRRNRTSTNWGSAASSSSCCSVGAVRVRASGSGSAASAGCWAMALRCWRRITSGCLFASARCLASTGCFPCSRRPGLQYCKRSVLVLSSGSAGCPGCRSC